jgi:hypothetical protein
VQPDNQCRHNTGVFAKMACSGESRADGHTHGHIVQRNSSSKNQSGGAKTVISTDTEILLVVVVLMFVFVLVVMMSLPAVVVGMMGVAVDPAVEQECDQESHHEENRS